jgi:hypothetical protein
MTTPMIADPAGDLPPAANSAEADAMLADILATPRVDPASRRRVALGPASVKRIAVGGLLAGAAVTAALAAPRPWGGHGNEADAYTVQRQSDGTLRVVVHWDQLADPAKLQQALDRAGAPVRVLVGTDGPGQAASTVPECAKPYAGGPYSAAAVSWDSGLNAPDNSFVVHPAAFPKDGTLVIEVFFAPGVRHPTSSLSFMAIGRVPTCALPR